MRFMLVTAALAGLVHGSPVLAGAVPLTTVRIANGLASPTFVTSAPGDPDRLFVLERAGRIRVIRNGVLLATPFLNITSLVSASGERGLLGIGFHPDYESTGTFYVRYNNTSGRTTVARYAVTADPEIADPDSGLVLLTVPQATTIHNGGWIGFGADGYLYITQGEGGGSSNAQDITDNWLGKVLRIDVNGDDFPADPARNYAIPPSNPFVGVTGDDEIWAYGLRNPYRAGFDRVTGDLWIGDVGAGSREELDFQSGASAGGENYGWGCMEGSICAGGSGCTCGAPDLTLPVHDYTHALGCVITAGTAYRGCAMPDMHGTYFFGDYCSGRIWSLHYDGQAVSDLQERTAELAPGAGMTINSIVAFGEDYFGEIHIVDLGGEVFKIVPATAPADRDGDGIPDACETQPQADLTGDGVVNGLDLATLLGQWTGLSPYAPCPPHATADFNQDCRINGLDVAILLGAWG